MRSRSRRRGGQGVVSDPGDLVASYGLADVLALCRVKAIAQNGIVHAATRPSTTAAPGMGMRPRPQHGTPHPSNRPPVFIPPVSSTHDTPIVHHLARPTPVPREEDDEAYAGPEFSVDEFGRYFETEVTDVRREALDVRGAGTRNGTDGRDVNERNGLTTSSSMGGTHPNPLAPPSKPVSQTNHRQPAPPHPPKPFPNALPNAPKRAFTRVPSQGGDARRHAIEAALSQGGPAGSQVGVGIPRAGSPWLGGGGGGTTNGIGRVDRPSFSAGVGNAEIEALRRQVAQVRGPFPLSSSRDARES